MKGRRGFVSNSSSSSFIVSKDDITARQLHQILTHELWGERLGIEYWNYPWTIVETDIVVKGSTFMDNFDMEEFLKAIGVDLGKVKWDR